MAYQPIYAMFGTMGPAGQARRIEFKKAGFLAAGDQPELYFFAVDGQPVVVGVSGEALKQWQRARRYLSREEKIDLAGLLLKRRVEAGAPLISENLFVDGLELEELVRTLGFIV